MDEKRLLKKLRETEDLTQVKQIRHKLGQCQWIYLKFNELREST